MMIESPVRVNLKSDVEQDEQSPIGSQPAEGRGNVQGSGHGKRLSQTGGSQVDTADDPKDNGSQMEKPEGKGMMGWLRELLMMLIQMLSKMPTQEGDAEAGSGSGGESMAGEVNSSQAGA